MDYDISNRLRDLVDRINQLEMNPKKLNDAEALNATYERIRSKVMRFQQENKSRFDSFKAGIVGEIDSLNKQLDSKNNVAS